jgi:hypothetical protein
VPLDEVKPGNKVSAQLKKIMLDSAPGKPKADGKAASPIKKFKFSVAQ